MDVDPETAYQHAQAAVSRAGRIGAVREAMGLVAYQLGKYEETVRELRTHRRITGSDDNLAVLADAERGRGRPAKALEIFGEADREKLSAELYTELVIVAAGAHTDLGDVKAARNLLDQQSFTGSASGSTVRLLSAYADLLRMDGDEETADKYEELARRTAKATNTLFGDEEPDPNADAEIITIEEIDDEISQVEAEDADQMTADEPDRAQADDAGDEARGERRPQTFHEEVEAELDEILAEAETGLEQEAEEPVGEDASGDREGPVRPEEADTEGEPRVAERPVRPEEADTEEEPPEEEATAPLFDL
nr:hypothetical protein [Brevibacterium daeguense]